MSNKFESRASIEIAQPTSVVFDALTDPEKVKQYLFGTEMKTDWKVESPITYRGEWEGKSYEDKGTVLEFEQDKLIVSTYWSSMSGTADAPENYQTVRYELDESNSGTLLTIIQTNIDSQESADHSEQNWDMVLQGIKKVCENA